MEMLCLLVETTSSQGSLGLYSLSLEKKNGKEIAIRKWQGPAHSAFITSAFEDFFKHDIKQKKSQISFVGLGVGPGRFTGVRVGVSFVKTLNYILRIPIYPVSSLKILAESQMKQDKPVLVLLNAFKNSLYMALYQNINSKMKELIPPSVVLPENLQKKVQTECICVGDGYSAYENFFPGSFKNKLEIKNNTFPEVKYLADFLNREFQPSYLIDWRELRPVYLRSPVQVIK